MQTYRPLSAVILTALSMLASPCFAVEDPPKAEKPAVKEGESDKAPAEEKKDAEKEESSLLDKLTKELLKEVDQNPAKPAAEKENKLDRAAKGMRTAGEKLDGDQTGSDTRKIQEQVIKDLDDLINQLQNPPPPPQGGGGGGGGGSSSSSGKSGQASLQKAGQGQAGRGQQQQSQGQGKPQGAGSEKMEGQQDKAGGQDKKNAEGSSERTESERKAAEEAARKKKLEMDVWGHLPPHLRDQLLNTYGERMLPKYQQLVKQFYEVLSDQGSTPPRR